MQSIKGGKHHGNTTISSNLYRVDPKTGEKITTPDSGTETASSKDVNDTFSNANADEENILQGMRALVEFAKSQKGHLDGAVPDEEFALEKQGIMRSSQTVWDSVYIDLNVKGIASRS